MADLLPVVVPAEYTRAGNIDHTGKHAPVPNDRLFSYGTAGFREKAEVLPFILFRVGYLAALRSRQLNKSIGIMITASHNPKEDNGVKIVDPIGEMLVSEWEKYATELANANDEELPTCVRALEVQVDPPSDCSAARVICAQDTRESGEHLVKAAEAGVLLFGVRFQFEGRLTTPQLHYIVRVQNDPHFGPSGHMGYHQRISEAFNSLIQLIPSHGNYTPLVHLDCANGVGAHQMHYLVRFLGEKIIDVEYHNEFGELNHLCGADHVKISQRPPADFENLPPFTRCASLDGDADRLIYFYPKENHNEIGLLDGDKIAILLARFFVENLNEAELSSTFTMAVVQTAYANGASTKYILKTLKLPTVFVPTGVKHLHHEAALYDIGIYFEANGHGTICFSDNFKAIIAKKKNGAGKRLNQMRMVVNEVVGDALADLLAVELCLRYFGWSVTDWATKLYEDLPSRQIKVPVADRSGFRTTKDETRLIEPAFLQTHIDKLVAGAGEDVRAFVRPSGTENIVRVYAEASTQEVADSLANAIALAITKTSS